MNCTWCEKLTDEAAKRLAEKRQSLQIVDCVWCGKLTDEAGKHLAEKCLSLQSVSFRRRDELASTSRKSAGACRA